MGEKQEDGVKMQTYCNRQLQQKQMSMNDAPVGFSSSLIPFPMWRKHTSTPGKDQGVIRFGLD